MRRVDIAPVRSRSADIEIRADVAAFGARPNGSKAMPRNSLTRRLLRHLLLVSLAGCFLAVFSRGWDEWDEGKEPQPQPAPTPEPAQPARKGKTRG